jgi:hypothetical protein
MQHVHLMCVVANKIDQAEKLQVSAEDGMNFVTEKNALYQETSALTGLRQPLESCAKNTLNWRGKEKRSNGYPEPITTGDTGKPLHCC